MPTTRRHNFSHASARGRRPDRSRGILVLHLRDQFESPDCVDAVGIDYGCTQRGGKGSAGTCVMPDEFSGRSRCLADPSCVGIVVSNWARGAATLKRDFEWDLRRLDALARALPTTAADRGPARDAHTQRLHSCRRLAKQMRNFSTAITCESAFVRMWNAQACFSYVGDRFPTPVRGSAAAAVLPGEGRSDRNSADPVLLTFWDKGTPWLAKGVLNANRTLALPPRWVRSAVNLAAHVPAGLSVPELFMAKLRTAYEWLTAADGGGRLGDEHLVVFVDGRDVVWGGCADFAARAQRAITAAAGRMILSAELPCGAKVVPREYPCSQYPPPPQEAIRWQEESGMLVHAECRTCNPAPCSDRGLYQHLNSGGWVGRKRAALSMLEEVLSFRPSQAHNFWGKLDDQVTPQAQPRP